MQMMQRLWTLFPKNNSCLNISGVYALAYTPVFYQKGDVIIKPIDLHVHSNKSDGSNTPSELVYMAMKKGLAAFALTDHDTVDGIDEALVCAQEAQKISNNEDIEVLIYNIYSNKLINQKGQ